MSENSDLQAWVARAEIVLARCSATQYTLRNTVHKGLIQCLN